MLLDRVKKIFKLSVIPVMIILTGCNDNRLEVYKNKSPELKIDSFFSGKVVGYGVLEDYTKKITKRFKVDMLCSWKDNEGVFDETFYWDDETTSKRMWKLKIQEDGKVIGTAEDVVGEAVGMGSGNAFKFNYSLMVPVDGKDMKIAFDDWMYALDKDRVMNINQMKKFGLNVGKVIIFLEKQ